MGSLHSESLARCQVSIRDLVRSAVRPFGLDIVRSHTTLDGHLARLLTSLGVNVVLDVGACDGGYSRLLRQIGYRGRIVSFEPIAESYAKLRADRRRDPAWRGMPLALSDQPGERPMHVSWHPDQTSFYEPVADARTWFEGAAPVKTIATVQVARLDDVIVSCLDGIQRPRVFLKMDTQGHDLAVLRGAAAALDVVVGMQSEVAVRALNAGAPLLLDSLEALTAPGFEITGLFGVSRETDQIAHIEYDCVLRRRPA
jgi:FkbM family methyltransferase